VFVSFDVIERIIDLILKEKRFEVGKAKFSNKISLYTWTNRTERTRFAIFIVPIVVLHPENTRMFAYDGLDVPSFILWRVQISE